jgi:ribosomal protein S18 acetylase RimI-like enzyme
MLGERAIEVLQAHALTRIVLEVLDDNDVAGALYRLGFHPARRLVGRTRLAAR